MRNVVVTGFGLFRDHKSNPSWEAIKDGQLKLDRPNINVVTKQVKVSYQHVDQLISRLWDEYKPVLMVHVGLAAFEDSIRIEQVARHGPYMHKDVDQQAPHEDLRLFYEKHTATGEDTASGNSSSSASIMEPACKFDCSQSCFNIERVCDKLNKLHKQGKVPIGFKCSQDAGLYVCEYIYQKSLRVCNRAVFIHVPDTDRFPLEDIRSAIKLVIEVLLDELNEIE
uniref:Pyroglutamyl-peptidase 1 n=1 Tax=Aceria tosichella TaxID=561515 RepID=A0A6G1SI80_9ACAR